MPNDRATTVRGNGTVSWGLVFPVLLVLSVLVVIVPVPPAILDLLLAANITAAVVILLTTVFVAKPLDFSVFPSLLLLATLARLVLNVASTRLILTRAATHETHAAGEVIEAFARFVAQDQLAVGLILFSILVVIQFVVVTKGATRLSEVAARFALDGMPGRQMAIDADLNAGHISAEEARARRGEIAAQADFHAAMDGAGKFVRGEAVAGILIVLINIVGGLAIGVIQHRMEPAKALEVFTMLTIGDGLVTQIPGFLIALAAALLATRSSSESNLSRDVIGQTLREPAALYLASATLFALAFTGLPMIPLMVLGVGCAFVGESLRKQRQSADAERSRREAAAAQQRSVKPAARPEDQLLVEPIEVELGFRLIRLANPEAGGDLMERVTKLRHRIAQESGIILPKVKIRDSLRLPDRGYQIKLRGVTIASGEVRPEGWLAVEVQGSGRGLMVDGRGLKVGGSVERTASLPSDPPPSTFDPQPNFRDELLGAATTDPASQRPAKWIGAEDADRAKELGYKLVEPANVLVAHLAEVVRSHADELLTRQHVHQLLDNLRQTSPKVVDELIPELLKPSQVHQILGNLLRERVPVRDLETILETLGDYADRTKDTTILTEYVRHALSRTICQPYRDASGTLAAITLDPALEDVLMGGFEFAESGPIIKLTPQITEGVTHELTRQVKKLLRAGQVPVVVCGPRVRPVLRHITAGPLPKLAVLSLNEIPRDTRLQSLGLIPLNAVKVPRRQGSESRSQKSEEMIGSLTAAAF